MHVSAMIQ